MKCENCGNYLVGNEKFCNGCGSPVHTISNNLNQQVSVDNNIVNGHDNVHTVNVSSSVPPKKKNTKMIVLIVLLVLMVGAGCAFGGYMLANNNNDSAEDKKENNDENNDVVQSSTSVYYADTTFMLPSDYMYTYDEQGLYISDGKWMALIQENSLPYDTIILAKEGLKVGLEQQGMAVISMNEKKITNEYLVISADVKGVNCLILITEIKNGKTLLIMMTDPNGTGAKESWINDIDKVLSNVKTIDRNNNYIDFTITDKFLEVLEGLEKQEIEE